MSLSGLIPSDVSLYAAIAICAIAFVSGTALGPAYAIGVWFGASLFGKASETVFRGICYRLIAAAVLLGLPALDGVLRGS